MLFVQLGGGGGVGRGNLKKFPKNWCPPPNFWDPLTEVRKCFVPTPPPPKKNHKRKKKYITMNCGQVQPSECFGVDLGTKLAQPEV